MKEIEAIRDAMVSLKPEVRVPWRTLDHLPYIHATDDPNAKPYNAPVVGRFDYMETAEYILACNPAAMRSILDHIDAQAVEIERLKPPARGVLVPSDKLAEMQAEIERLRADAGRYRWLKNAKGLTLESGRGSAWTREDGTKFTPSHRLCAGGTQFAPQESLDDAIDSAMKEDTK